MTRSILAFLLLVSTSVFVSAQTDSDNYTKYGIADFSIPQLSALEVGQNAPSFKATDQNNQMIDLNILTQDNNVILIFYRGNWCPYCTRYLAEFNDRLDDIKAKNTIVVAISPEGNQNISKTSEMISGDFHFVSDSDNAIMDAYNVRFNVTDTYKERFKNWRKGETLAEVNQQEEATLPVPATYLIGKGGKIKWVHFDPDYSERGDVDDLINAL